MFRLSWWLWRWSQSQTVIQETKWCESRSKLPRFGWKNKFLFTTLMQVDHFILDVDLDFYSTLNPFINLYSEAGLYEKLRELYTFKPGLPHPSWSLKYKLDFQCRATWSLAWERKRRLPQEKKGKKKLKSWVKSSPSSRLRRAWPPTVALGKNTWQRFRRSMRLWANIVQGWRWTGSWSTKLGRLSTTPSCPTMCQLPLRSRLSSDRLRPF